MITFVPFLPQLLVTPSTPFPPTLTFLLVLSTFFSPCLWPISTLLITQKQEMKIKSKQNMSQQNETKSCPKTTASSLFVLAKYSLIWVCPACLVCLVTLHWRKRVFHLPAGSFSARRGSASTPFSELGFLSGVKMWWSRACCTVPVSSCGHQSRCA